MKLRAKLFALTAIALLLVPNVAYADSRNNDCEQEDDCRDDNKREKPKFQTKFFSE
jgi:hypothetical protein